MNSRFTINSALSKILNQMEISGYRPRTLHDYNLHVSHYSKVSGAVYVDDINSESIYKWLSGMEVNPQTKLTRLKCLKAFLSRCFDEGWVSNRFWTKITIKVDINIKEGTTEENVKALLSKLDYTDFVQFRDGVAVLLMFKTGIRVNSLVQLENRHVDLENRVLRLDGEILKNRQQLTLPLSEELNTLLTRLIKENNRIRRKNIQENNYIFITKHGGRIATDLTNNNIIKRLKKYSNQYELDNINAHSLRRGFAKSLLIKGADIATISRALGHSNLAVTTKYLHLDNEELIQNLRKYI